MTTVDAADRPLAARERRPFALAAVGVAVFVVYGSLVPFEFTTIPLGAALGQFAETPWLNMGIGSRADWVANLLLYAPIAFLLLAAVWPPTLLGKTAACVAVWGISTGLAVVVEFVQVFTPRTVSLNDLVAESLGAAIGVVAWAVAGGSTIRLLRAIAGGGRQAIVAALVAYLAGYLWLSLFPYDFLISAAELADKLQSAKVDAFLAPGKCQGFTCGVKIGVEIAAAAPLGALLSLLAWTRRRRQVVLALLVGASFGLVIELAQIFIASGVSQGLSILTRAVGSAGGVLLAGLAAAGRHWVAWGARWLTLLGFLPYLVALAALNGWLTRPWGGLARAVEQLPELNFTPFYYHYYTSEQMATVSLLKVALAYAPVGLAAWAWAPRAGAGWPAIVAAALAAAMETGRLFQIGARPDPTNVLIAAIAAALLFALLRWVERWGTEAAAPSAVAPEPQPANAAPPPLPPGEAVPSLAEPRLQPSAPRYRPFAWTAAVAIAVALIWIAWRHPFGPAWTLPILALWTTLLWSFPRLWLIAIPALLPTLDLARWTGWFFVDEFELLALAALAVLLIRGPAPALPASRTAIVLFALFAVSCAAATWRGLSPWPIAPFDANALYTYTTPWNALRVGAGFFLGFAFAPFVWRELAGAPDGARRLAWGLFLGLAGVGVAVLHERFLYSGLFNFDKDFRVTAGFSSMHTGGGHIGGFLAAALPFALAPLLAGVDLRRIAIAAGVLGSASYALLTSYARAAWLAVAASLAMLALAGMLMALRGRRPRLAAAVLSVSLAAVALSVVAAPLLADSFVGGRLARIADDLDSRVAHWMSVLALIPDETSSRLFGMGFGRYPEARAEASRSPADRHAIEFGYDDRPYLRLAGGHSLYYEQRIFVQPGQPHILGLDLRADAGGARLNVAFCEKALHYSFSCRSVSAPAGGEWRRFETVVEMEDVGVDRGRIGALSRRPVFINLYVSRPGSAVAISNISLISPSGEELIRNGDFEQGGETWYFAEDQHAPWQVENMYLQVFFDQGWFGLASFLALTFFVFVRLLGGVAGGEVLSALLLASLTAFCVAGLATALIDAPRLSFFYLLLLSAGVAATARQPMSRRQKPPGQSMASTAS